MSERVLVTGANGFIGEPLTKELACRGYDVYALERYVSNRYNIPSNRGVKTVFADLTDHMAIASLVRQIRPEVIVHLAALSPVATSYDRWGEYLETNFNATVNLAECALRFDENLRQFVYAATSECYGNQTVLPIKESALYLPNSPYAVSKVASVNYLRYMWDAYKFPVTIMFPFNSYGRVNCRHFITEKIIWQMLTQSSLRLGDPGPIRDLVYVDDHVDGYVSVLEYPKASVGEGFNICTGYGTSIKCLVSKLRRLTGFKGDVVWDTIPSRPLDIMVLVGDNSKIHKLVGWKPKVSLDVGLKRTVDCLKGALD